MTTLSRLDEAEAHAKMLYAELHSFSLETVNPTAKAMWTELARTTLQIATSITKRKANLLARENEIHTAAQASEEFLSAAKIDSLESTDAPKDNMAPEG